MVGRTLSTTLMFCEQTTVLPTASLASNSLTNVKGLPTQPRPPLSVWPKKLTKTPGQLSEAVTSAKFAGKLSKKQLRTVSEGQMISGSSKSITAMENEQSLELPDESVAVAVTTVVPVANVSPVWCESTNVTEPQSSVAVTLMVGSATHRPV